jgi:hypothetical protein
MSENQKNTSEIWATPESNQDILAKQSASVQKIIEKDPILAKNLDQIINPKEFFEKLAQSAHIFEQTDNLWAQKTFLEQSLKGLEYWQYTKDGREFAKLSDEEVGKLDDADAEKYLGWLEKKENEQKQKTITEEQRLAWNKEKAIKLTSILASGKEISQEVQKAKDSLSKPGQAIIESKLTQERDNPDNPINRELAKTLSPEEIKDPKYDDIRRASIMIWIVNDPKEYEKFKLQGGIKDETVFLWSINKIKKLWVVPSIVNLDNYSAHIDSRFPRGESTERAKWEIAHSIASGNVASIYYDGKWEKYTLLDKDGKTSKEVYMNPPRIRVAQNGFEAEEAIVPSEDTRKRADKENELWVIKGKTQEKIGNIAGDLTQTLRWENTEYKELLQNPIFSENFPVMSSPREPNINRIESTEKLIQAYREARDTPTINKDIYDRKIQELDEVKRSLQEEIKLQWVIASLPITSSEDFENNVKANFATLSTEPRLYNRFPRAQELLTGILGEINRTRDGKNQIQIGEKVLWQSEKGNIDEAYEKVLKSIGTNKNILKSADIGTLWPKINNLLANNAQELKKLLRGIDTPSSSRN